jgi:anti-sigma factor ChrR (cupin superfamily)
MLMCRDLARIASDYIEGELRPIKSLSVRMHLLMCRHCRAFVTNLRNSVVLIQRHSSLKVNEGLIDRIDAEIAQALAGKPDDEPGDSPRR